MMEVFRLRNLRIYPKGQIAEEGLFLLVDGKHGPGGWHTSESTSLNDDEVDALHQWLSDVIAERDNGS